MSTEAAAVPETETRPSSLNEYIEWARTSHSVDFGDAKTKNRYDTNITVALSTIQSSDFYGELTSCLAQCEAEYYKAHRVPLLMNSASNAHPIRLVVKPYESALDKSFRKNVLWNRRFPSPPKRGWVLPSNWYAALNDAIRGTIVCKFIDGPSFLVEKLKVLADKMKLPSRSYSQERDEGYYAYHFYTTFDVPLVDAQWETSSQPVELELQVTTQLQEVLRQLTHPFYESSRLNVHPDDGKWKWDFRSNRFRGAYLSHTLHLLEATLVELRDTNVAREGTIHE